jgi:hypothetical protein
MSVFSKFLSLQSAVPRTVDLSSASSILGLSNMQLLGSTSGYIQMAANSTTTPYTITWPAAIAGGSGYVLTSDASGNLTWAPAATSGITQLTGDVTAGPGTGSQVATLATVNSNTGSFGSSTAIPSFTVNGKGLITAASTNAVVAPAGTLTGTTLASNVVSSSLTSVGTITSGTWNGSAIGPIYGGTGLTSYNTGDTLYASASNVLSALPIGTSGQVLTVVAGIPAWETPATSGTVTSVSVVSTNGFAGTVANPSTTPAITIETTINSPVLAGNGTAISAATTTGSGSTVVLADAPTFAGNVNLGGFEINDLAMAGSPAGTDATNVTYVNAQIAAAINGLTWKGPVSAYATSNVPLTGGATLTIDSYAVQNGNYVILSNQTTASQNNVYVASGIGTAYTLSLAPAAELTTAIGDAYLIEDGTVWANSAVQANAISPNNTYIQFAGPNFYTFTSPLSLTGTTVSVGYDNSTIAVNGSNQLYVPTSGITSTQLANGAVTYAKIQNESADTLLGNPTGSAASPSEITLGATLSFSGTVLETGAGTGDVTWSANSFVTTLATVNSSPGTFAIATLTVNAKGLVTAASAASTTGTGAVVLASSPSLTTPNIGAATASNLNVTSLTASEAVFTDSSKNLVSNPITGTGNVVMSASPTLTGTISAANQTLSGNLVAPIVQVSGTYQGPQTLAANTTYALRWGIPSNSYYTFTIPSSSITAGTVYTNNGQTFTVVTTTSSSTSLLTYATGAPTSSGTLTFVSGSPSGNLSFSAESATAEVAGDLYLADWNTSLVGLDIFWVAGLYNSTSSTPTGTSVTITTKGSFTLGSSDTAFGSVNQGKPYWLGSAGAFTPNSTFSPASGDANEKLGIVTGATTVWVDLQMMGVS